MMIGKEARKSQMSKDQRDYGMCTGGGQEEGFTLPTLEFPDAT